MPNRSFAFKTVLFCATVLTGLSAGFFYGWQVGAIPGFLTLDDGSYITAMNAVNSQIRNTGFAIILFGSPLLIIVAAVLAPQKLSWQFATLLTALALYLVGLLGITFVVHVPMNEAMLQITDLTTVDIERVRSGYETRWNNWHIIRTGLGILAFATLLLAGFLRDET